MRSTFSETLFASQTAEEEQKAAIWEIILVSKQTVLAVNSPDQTTTSATVLEG